VPLGERVLHGEEVCLGADAHLEVHEAPVHEVHFEGDVVLDVRQQHARRRRRLLRRILSPIIVAAAAFLSLLSLFLRATLPHDGFATAPKPCGE